VVGGWSEWLQHDQPDESSIQKGESPDSEITSLSEEISKSPDSQQLLRCIRRKVHAEWREYLWPRMKIVEKGSVVVYELAHDETVRSSDCLTHA
jgi:hypothetical protein